MSNDFTIQFDTRDFIRFLNATTQDVMKGGKRGVNDAVDEVIRISTEITPIDKSTLSKSHSRDVKVTDSDIKATVGYYVQEDGFNYALRMHEDTYNLGETSKGRSGTQGWSGKHYSVGNKYLERPIKGEEKAIHEHIAKEIKRELGG